MKHNQESGSNLENKEQSDEQNQIVGDLPKKNPEIKYPVKPKDSASLIVLRNKGNQLQVLMGRRGRKAVFSNVYVFPGGKLEASDKLTNPASKLRQNLSERISTDTEKSTSFAMAAVRETFEETGLFLGAPGDIGETHNESWNQVRALGLAPALAKLEYVGHAITPASKAFRFNARFFYAWASDMSGQLGGSGELADLAFLDIEKALELPLVDVTQFMLEEIIRRKENDFNIPATYPFFGYRKDRQYQRYK